MIMQFINYSDIVNTIGKVVGQTGERLMLETMIAPLTSELKR